MENEPRGDGGPSIVPVDSGGPGPGRRRRQRRLPLVALGVLVIVLVSSIAYYRLLSPPPLTTKQVIALIEPSVVTVKVTVFRSDPVEASGFVYQKRGHILTNALAVGRALTINVVDASGVSHPAGLIGVDRAGDVAELLAYDMVAGFAKAQPLKAASRPVAAGAKVLVIGNPFGIAPNNVTNGVVRGTGRSISDGSTTFGDLIETDAVFNPRNIGGPMVDSAGDLVGMATIRGSDNVFATPVAGFEADSKTWTHDDNRIPLGPPRVSAGAKSLVLGGVGPGFQVERSEPWGSKGYFVFYRKSRTSNSDEQGIGISLLVDDSESQGMGSYQFYLVEASQQGYSLLVTKLDLGDEASAYTATGLRKWGGNNKVVWRDRNVIVILDWDADYPSDVAFADVLALADLQAKMIDADLASYQ